MHAGNRICDFHTLWMKFFPYSEGSSGSTPSPIMRKVGGGSWFNCLPPFPSRIRGRRPYPTWSFIRKFVEIYMSISK